MRYKPVGQLRIVAGMWRSRLLRIADVEGLRPTSARIRETLFNWLAMDIHGARCLDLCAGTGALGIEALSRGAVEVVFVEPAKSAVSALHDNLAALQTNAGDIVPVRAEAFLNTEKPREFDIVFLDPPFAADLYDELCRLLSERGWLAAGAKVYIELDKSRPALHLPTGWTELKNKTAGQVRYMLATNAEQGDH